MTATIDGKMMSRQRHVDAVVDRHVGRAGESRYDSVVIAGSGIGSQVFAAQLAKYPKFRGKITIVAPPQQQSRRLINGCSLRGLAADFIASALGTTHDELLGAAAGDIERSVVYRQTAAMATRTGAGVSYTKSGQWHRRGGNDEPLLYGLRNSALVGAIGELIDRSSVHYVEEKVASAEHLRGFAAGERPLLVNATTFPGLLGTSVPKPKKMVLAVQAALVAGPSGPIAPVEPQTAFAPLFRRDGAIDVGYFMPFADPLSPRANYYGIIARVVDDPGAIVKEREHEIMLNELESIVETAGMSIDDPDETLAKALVPASPWGSIPPSPSGGLDLKRMYSGGAPCFYADGMVSSAVGGVVGAEAVARGVDPDKAIRSALKGIRNHNFLWWCETNRIPLLADGLMRVNVPAAMVYPHSAGLRYWRSAA